MTEREALTHLLTTIQKIELPDEVKKELSSITLDDIESSQAADISNEVTQAVDTALKKWNTEKEEERKQEYKEAFDAMMQQEQEFATPEELIFSLDKRNRRHYNREKKGEII